MLRFNFMRTMLLATLIVAAAQTSAFAENTEPCEIAVPMQQNDWGEELVGTEIMNTGDRRSIRYDPQYSRYKIKIRFAGEGAETITWYDVDLLDTWRLSIIYNGSGYEFAKNARG